MATKSKANRKQLMRAGVMLAMAIALFVCQFSVPTGSAQTIGVEFIFDIVPDTDQPAFDGQFAGGRHHVRNQGKDLSVQDGQCSRLHI
jgi:hypothetical protein